ncbi:hypothetical protein F5878DRAFT_528918 [Lentinula raphanica]|uniref:Uncharacterized protein n=1 Tax=Lentinula raphanica TaxID=153919 RepID=A0AA38UIT6_9AGAR|nr:hypothetical protein F5878DRAFT_528918 [Lentinula raphanica]
MHSFPYLTFLFILSLQQNAMCIIANITVDDSSESPAIVYSPASNWHAGSKGSSCSECNAHPNSSDIRTWHESTFTPNGNGKDDSNTPLFANLTFTGSAVYVFCALAESSVSPNGNSDMAFYIDGQLNGTFVKPAQGINNTYEYQSLVYSIDSLVPGKHTLSLQNGYTNSNESLVILDYIVFSYVLVYSGTYIFSTGYQR